MRSFVVFAFVCVLFRETLGDSTFRFGAVLSTEGPTRDMLDAKNGYELYFDAVNAQSDGRGFLVGGKAGTKEFYFNYTFIWREDFSDRTIHKKQVKELLEDDKVHFLGGSHPNYANDEMKMANASNVLCYHCCVAPDVFYERDYRTSFGITASNKAYTEAVVRVLSIKNITSISLVYDKDNEFTRTTCEAAEALALELGKVQHLQDMFSIRFHRVHATLENITLYANTAKAVGIEAIFACIFMENGKLLMEILNTIEYSLKALFMTVGPTKQQWVDSLEPPELANDLLSAVQWHPKMKYSDDFFGSTKGYAKQYQERFSGRVPDHDAAGASAVGLTLTMAIKNAFINCDITKTDGEVDKLLFDFESVECDDDLEMSGYDRIMQALAELNTETFYGKVKFNDARRNIGLIPVTTQVVERKSGENVYREIEPVLPVGFATELIRLPGTNRFKEDCPPGSFVGPDEFDPCVLCPEGQASRRVNAKHCDGCPIGRWMNMTGQTSCRKCPPGTTTKSTRSTKITDCFCADGHFSLLGETGVECEPCPDGATCSEATGLPVPVQGFWANTSEGVEIYPCDPAFVCLGGNKSECREGYTGRLCAECDAGYFSVIQECYKCFSSGLIVFFCVCLLCGWYVINVIVSQNVASLGMILTWAQLANIIGDINLNWTPMLTTMFGVANILDFDVDILEPSCLLSWGFRQNFIVQLCLPVVMSLMAACGYLFSVLVYQAMERNWIILEGHARQVVALLVELPEAPADLRKKWDTTLATFLASIDITYVTIAKYCFDSFKCKKIGGALFLEISPDVECGTSEHKQIIVLAALGVAFYVIGYLALISWKLYDLHDKRAFSDEISILRFGFIYQKYELDYYYTPAVEVIRKLLFVLVLVYVNNPAFQVGALAIVINASLMLHVYTAPYIETYLDILFNFLLLALMFEAFGGLMFYSENLPEVNRHILEWIVMSALFLLLCVSAVMFVMEMVTKYQIHFLKKKHQKFATEEYGYSSRGLIAGIQYWKNRNRASPQFRRGTSLSSVSSSVKHMTDGECELLHTFHPHFVYRVLKARPDLIHDWDKLTTMLHSFMSDQSETSYLSISPTAKFWRKLVDRFPELIDFLAVADDSARMEFNNFATSLYNNFYLPKKVTPLPLMKVLNWRDYAPMAQWLSMAPEEDRVFLVNSVSEMFRATGTVQGAMALETKLENGGHDPEFLSRFRDSRMSKKKRGILDILGKGSSPFHHSAFSRTKTLSSTLSDSMNLSQSIRESSALPDDFPPTPEGMGDFAPSPYLSSSVPLSSNGDSEISCSSTTFLRAACSKEGKAARQRSIRHHADSSGSNKAVCFSVVSEDVTQ